MDEAREWLKNYDDSAYHSSSRDQASTVIRSLLAELEKLSTVQLPNGKISNTFEAYLAWKSKAEQAEAERDALVRYLFELEGYVNITAHEEGWERLSKELKDRIFPPRQPERED